MKKDQDPPPLLLLSYSLLQTDKLIANGGGEFCLMPVEEGQIKC